MIVIFGKPYLKELYTLGKCHDKHHRYQPQIVQKFINVIKLMILEENVQGLCKYGALHYEHLRGDKAGLSSVRINNQYRIEFAETKTEDSEYINICTITDLSNHYN